jgi:protein gp37
VQLVVLMDAVTRAAIDGGTRISWADYTFNPWRGCVKVSPACRFCYAERDTARWGGDFWGKNAPRPISGEGTWAKPRRWNREAKEAGVKRRVFSGSLCDVFEDRDDLADARSRLFDLVETTENLIWMLLTKRPENIAKLAARYAKGWPGNVWLGVSAETQRFANERIPHLIRHPVTVRFVSAGPILGPVALRSIPYRGDTDYLLDVLHGRYRTHGDPTDGWGTTPFSSGMANLHRIDWVITEGESGQKAGIRPSHPDWYRTFRDQATRARVPYHHKQNGIWVAEDQLAEVPDRYVGHDWDRHPKRHLMLAADGRSKPVSDWDGTEDPADRWVHMLRFPTPGEAGRLLDDRVWDEFPEAAHV